MAGACRVPVGTRGARTTRRQRPRFDGLFCAGLIHIAPWDCTAAMMQLAATRLTRDGMLITYGPYLEDGVMTAPGDLAFDADLRARNPAWGVPRLEAVGDQARQAGLHLREIELRNLGVAYRCCIAKTG